MNYAPTRNRSNQLSGNALCSKYEKIVTDILEKQKKKKKKDKEVTLVV